MVDNFASLNLNSELLQAISESEYEQPTPIQLNAIPHLIAGRDVLGQAQTGTGKTAAFTLPMLQRMDTKAPGIQALILTPTRELAGQVSNNVFRYGKFMNIRVMPIYGGQSYDRQFKRLERSPQVIVGTPGRILDMINRKALDFSTVKYLVLDEADEMLKMGFIEDVEAILQAVPTERQTALFSATFSDEIRRLSANYMNDPVVITVKREQMTLPAIEQRHYLVMEEAKLATLARLLETEDLHSALIFTRTRTGSAELAEALLERGFVADALHGELNQAAREAVLRRFRSGALPILAATDVVARGVDISDVSHVFNYDIPFDPEDYVHRIGRTGRAGRSGIAITLVTPRERRRLQLLESFTKQRIPRAELPKPEEVRAKRNERFVHKINHVLTNDAETLAPEVELLDQMQAAGYDMTAIAAAAMRLARSEELVRPIEDIKVLQDEARGKPRREGGGYRDSYREGSYRDGDRRRSAEGSGGRYGSREGGRAAGGEREEGRRPRRTAAAEPGMVRLMLNVGHNQGIRPGDVVGAIASEAGIPGKAIGAIDIQKEQTFVDVKEAHVEKVLKQMRNAQLRGKPLQLTRASR